MGNACMTILTTDSISNINIENEKKYEYKLYRKTRAVKYNNITDKKKKKKKNPNKIINNHSIAYNNDNLNFSNNSNENIDNFKNIRNKSYKNSKEEIPETIENTTETIEDTSETIDDISETIDETINKSIDKIVDDDGEENIENIETDNGITLVNIEKNKEINKMNKYIANLEEELVNYSMEIVKMKLEHMNKEKMTGETIKNLKKKNGRLFKHYIELKNNTNPY